MAKYNPLYAAKLSVVIGILSISGLIYPSAGALFSAIGLTQGVRGLKSSEPRTSWLGIILSMVGLALSVLKALGYLTLSQ